MAAYGMAVRLQAPYDAAVARAREALKDQGFGVLTEIDVQKTLQEKLGAKFKRYVILGACNPQLAHRAFQAEEEIGLLLPCNVIVYEEGDHSVVAALDPETALGLVGNAALTPIAAEAKQRLRRALDALEAGS
ncbi:MAG: DUF302 domain-containing protein [Thermaerobacter sp.]|nr:DUF302 domain-containing protein [Thermaerobacter sp.]